jgi:hypothetical protein
MADGYKATCIRAKSDGSQYQPKQGLLQIFLSSVLSFSIKMLELTLLYLLTLLLPITPTTQLSLPTASFTPHALRLNTLVPLNLSLADFFK